jgi:hypothetical protein
MALHDNPPHRVSFLSVTSSTDGGGGVSLSYASAQAAVPASVNTASSSEMELFSQQGIVVTHSIAVLTSALSVTPSRGWKITDDGTSATYHIEGIRRGQAYGGIPAFTYFQVRSQE